MNIKLISKLLTLTIAISFFGQAAEGLLDRDELIKKGKSVNQFIYPDAECVQVSDSAIVEYQKDGSYVVDNDECTKILTEAGKRGHTSASLSYDLAYGTSMFVLVEIIKPDGTVVAIDLKTNSKTMTDPSQMGSNMYNPNIKVVTLSIPGLEVGDMVRKVIQVKCTKARMPDAFSDFFLLELSEPYLHSVAKIIGPKDMPLLHKQLRSEIPGTVEYKFEEKDAKNEYTWTLNNVKQIFPEPSMPGLERVAQRLYVSTVPDWKTVSIWYDGLCQKPLSSTNAAMVAKVAELTKDCKTDMEKIKAIFHFVSKKVRYMGLTTEDTAPGYEPHAVSTTFDNLYGVCRDKAALLVAMQRIAGFKAHPALVKVGTKKDPEIPTPSFNHAIACVELEDGEYILMDPTDETTKDMLPAYLSDCSYLVAKPEGDTLRTIEIVPAADNMVLVDMKAKVDKDGKLSCEVIINLYGINDNGMRAPLSTIKEYQLKKAFESMSKAAANGGELVEYEVLPKDMEDTTTNISIRIKFTAKDFPITNGEMLTLPSLSIGGGFAAVSSVIGATGLEKRKYPYVTGSACGITEHFEIDLSEIVDSVISLPKIDKVDNEFMYLDDNAVFTNKIIVGNGTFKILKEELSTNQYLTLKKILKDITYASRKRSFFKQIPNLKIGSQDSQNDETRSDEIDEGAYGGANTLTLKRTFNIKVTGQGEYEYITSVRKKILTYAGKKGASELSFGYNPIRDDFKLLEARVINPDGEIKEISEEEINIMDAGWVSSAPRYPGAKTLVATLPDVEVGSILEYKYRYIRKDRMFYATSSCFKSSEPYEKDIERIEVVADLDLEIIDYQGGSYPYTHSREGTTNVYTWESTCTNTIKSESSTPPSSYYLPGYYASTGNWKEYAKEIKAQLDIVTANQTNCIAKAIELTASCSNRTEKIIAIRNYIEKNIRSAGPNFLSLPLSCLSKGDLVLKDAYGNAADFAVVYYCMLEGLGFETEFLLSSGIYKIDGIQNRNIKCPQKGIFDYLMVRVKNDAKWIYLNDTSEYSELGTTGSNKEFALCLKDNSFWHDIFCWNDDLGDIYTVDIPAFYEGKGRDFTNVKLLDDGTAIYTITNWVYGTSFGSFHQRFKEMTPEERRRFELELVSSISQTAKPVGPIITDYSQYPGLIALKVEIDQFAVVDGDSYYFNIANASGNELGLTLNKRKYPILWSSFIDSDSLITIELPPSFTKVLMAPIQVKWKAPKGAGELIRYTKFKDGKLTVDKRNHIDPVVIPVSEYAKMLESNRKISHPGQNLILLQK